MFSTNYYYESVYETIVDVQNQFIDKYICENYRLSSVFHIKHKKSTRHFHGNRRESFPRFSQNKCQAQPVLQHVSLTKETCPTSPFPPAERQKDCASYISRKEFWTKIYIL